ncbi:uncharacterized protein LOC122320323 [Drosophila ficusphila]|uniref:uncharacterized protein LOC122320323 n=1 Tax=Drosophila ficusphila TaxID=30025 RepID=UPI001C89D7EE|nr:uncharacterized protein LOC122320323 [Drosophila ficusphila]
MDQANIVDLCSSSESDATPPRAPSPKPRDRRLRREVRRTRTRPPSARSSNGSEADRESANASPPHRDGEIPHPRRPASPRCAPPPEAYVADDSDDEWASGPRDPWSDDGTRYEGVSPRYCDEPRYAPSPEAYVQDDSDYSNGPRYDDEGASDGRDTPSDAGVGYGGVPHQFFEHIERYVTRHSHWIQLLQVHYTSCWIRMPFRSTEDPIIEPPISPEPNLALVGPDPSDVDDALDPTAPPSTTLSAGHSTTGQARQPERVHSAPDDALVPTAPPSITLSAGHLTTGQARQPERVHSAPDDALDLTTPSWTSLSTASPSGHSTTGQARKPERVHSAPGDALDPTAPPSTAFSAVLRPDHGTIDMVGQSKYAYAAPDAALDLTPATKNPQTAYGSTVCVEEPDDHDIFPLGSAHATFNRIPVALRMLRVEGTYAAHDAARQLNHAESSDTASGKSMAWSSQSSNSDEDDVAIFRRSRRRKRTQQPHPTVSATRHPIRVQTPSEAGADTLELGISDEAMDALMAELPPEVESMVLDWLPDGGDPAAPLVHIVDIIQARALQARSRQRNRLQRPKGKLPGHQPNTRLHLHSF